MRLAFAVLLLALACCCYQAEAKVCPALLNELKNAFMDPPPVFATKLKIFRAPQQAIQAKVKVNKCMYNSIPYEDKLKIEEFLDDIVSSSTCNS